jgi:DNA-binding transcriptional LysR family regulator
VAQDIERGRLRRILQDYETTPAPVNVLFERARRTSPSVRAFLDYLVESTETGTLAGMSRFGEALGAKE